MKNKSSAKRKYGGVLQVCSMRSLFLAALLTLLGGVSANLLAQLPTGFVARKLTTNNIKECVKIEHAPDGRIFMAERSGALKVLKDGVVTTITTVNTTTADEQGFLGMALHSSFAQNGKLYVYYTSADKTKHYLDVIVLDAASQIVSNTRLMEFDPILAGYHNGGAMVFKNGYLYLCIGESNTQQQAQLLDTYRGKVLRLLDDGQPAPGNPYYNVAGASRQKQSIWAIGMRNPWSMSMDPVSGKLFVGNVGGGYEEINDVTTPDPAKNYDYGWGTAGQSGPGQSSGTILPAFCYNKTNWYTPTANGAWNAPSSCAITTALFFNPANTNYPNEYKNKFYFGDWCHDWLRSIDPNNPSAGFQEPFLSSALHRILGLSVGIDGNIYYSEYAGTGNIWRLEYTLSNTPIVVNQPTSQTIYAQDAVSFSVSASGTGPLSYKWQKNGVDIPGATSSTYTIGSAAVSDGGNYKAIVYNAYGEAISSEAVLTVKPYNAIPVADIITPLSSNTASVLDVINYSGDATDAEDGTLPASAFEWEVRVFHKDCGACEHWHPGPAATDGVKSGSFIADNGGETSANVWFRLILRVTDSEGRVGIDSVDLQPNKVVLTVNSNRPGLQVAIGSSSNTPYTKTQVVNNATNMTAISPQTFGDTVYTFSSWDHGGPASQNFRVPNVNTTYKANFIGTYVPNTNIALNKKAYSTSNQNAGNNASKAVDGVANSRWESQFADPQALVVNLGAVYNITRVKITWENAKAKNYELQTSNDSINWTPIKSVSDNATDINEWSNLAGTGKFIRMYGTQRTTAYGYSIYEFEVFGALAPGGNLDPAVSITAPANNASFAAPAAINITANASDADGTVSKVDFYNGTTLLGTDNTAPYAFPWNNVAAGTYTISAKATDNGGAVATSSIAVTVTGASSNSNIALGKYTSASTVLNGSGNTALKATDGIADSRWESEFADPQWIMVNLGAKYDISQVKIKWENAMAKTYMLQTSNDSINWTDVKQVNDNAAELNDHTGLTASGKYVRIYGTERTTGYGYSIFELEVYGTPSAVTNANPTVSLTAPVNNASFTAPASISISANAVDADGTVSKVDFYNGATLLGTDNTAPYTYTWSNVAAGTYAITAKATDNQNATTTSAAVNVTVNAVSGTNLALSKIIWSSSNENGGTPATGANDGVANTRWSSKFADPQWITVDLGASYDINRVKITWENAKAKDYQIRMSNDTINWTTVKPVSGNTATVNDHTGLTGSGRYLRIYGTARTTAYGYSIFELEAYGTLAGVSNTAPTVSLTSPANNATFTSPASISIAATAADADGTVSKVDFYNGATLLGTATVAPYTFSWNNVAAGTYTITAQATDNQNAVTTSAAVNITVNTPANVAPTVSLTSPSNNAVFTSPAAISIAANAADADGTVSKVDFYNGATLLGTDNTAPYTFTWSNVGTGTYAITAKATDNSNAETTSAAVNVTVNAATNVNLALSKLTWASSIENGGTQAYKATDGVANSRWSSKFADPQWITVDLGAVYDINRVKITWENAKGKNYQVLVSNDTVNWTSAKTVTGNTALVNDHTGLTSTGRYVRIYGTARTTGYGYSIFELEVYGTLSPAPAPMAAEETTTTVVDLISVKEGVVTYPNPFSNELTVIALFQTPSMVNLLIVDVKGSVVVDRDYENTSGHFENKINVENLPAGQYVLKLFSGNEVFTQKLVKY
ncbi:MAG: discoidin domain-containing protein [Flavobacteriales bacterium]